MDLYLIFLLQNHSIQLKSKPEVTTSHLQVSVLRA